MTVDAGRRATGSVIGVALAIAIAVPALISARQMSHVFAYVSPDGAHALTDSAALTGSGIRPLRHPPAVPLIVSVVRFFANDLSTIRLLGLIGAIAMPLAFYFFIRGRTQSRVGDVAATALFGLAPPTAEAIGWNGIVMLIGICFALVAMRAVDDWLASPTHRRSVIAGIAVALVSLSHPIAFSWLCQVSFLIVAIELGGIAVRRTDADRQRFGKLLRTLPGVLAGTMIAGLVTLAFAGGLQNDVRIAPALSRLRLIGTFGFREQGHFWLVLCAYAAVALPVVAFRSPGPQRRLAGWAFASGLVATANIVAISAEVSYQTRQLYLLPVAAAVAAGLLVAAAVRSPARATAIASAAIALGTLGVWVLATRAFDTRAKEAVRFYNQLDSDQLSAIDWIKAHGGTVAVAPRVDDFYEGVHTSWLIEGLANVRAIGAGQGFVNQYASERSESDAAVEMIGGTTGEVRANLLKTQGADGVVRIFGRVDHAWYPIVSVRAALGNPPVVVLSANKIIVTCSSPLTVAPLTSDGSTLPLRNGAALLRARDGSRVTANLRRDDSGPAAIVGGNDVEYTPPASGSATEVRVDIAGLAQDQLRTRTYESARLISERSVRWIWAWRVPGDETANELRARGFRTEFENNSIALFATS